MESGEIGGSQREHKCQKAEIERLTEAEGASVEKEVTSRILKERGREEIARQQPSVCLGCSSLFVWAVHPCVGVIWMTP